MSETGFTVLQAFPGVLIAVGHFIDSFIREMNFMYWEFESIHTLVGQI